MNALLSSREVEVLELITLEYTTKEIATKLFISAETLRSHRKKMFSKMQVSNVAGLVRSGFEIGILKVERASMNQILKYYEKDNKKK